MDVNNGSGGGVGYGQGGSGGGGEQPEATWQNGGFVGEGLCKVGSIPSGQGTSWTPCDDAPWTVFVGDGEMMIQVTTSDPDAVIVYGG